MEEATLFGRHAQRNDLAISCFYDRQDKGFAALVCVHSNLMQLSTLQKGCLEHFEPSEDFRLDNPEVRRTLVRKIERIGTKGKM
jgi:hypothetical protein